MEKAYTKTIEIKTTTGATAKVSASLILSKTINADGDKVVVDCCELGAVKAEIGGFPTQTGFLNFHGSKETDFGTIYGCIENFGLIKENFVKVSDLITDLKKHPAWTAKQAKIDNNIKMGKEMESKMKKHPGYCSKCGSYCYGDCDAN